MIVSTTGFAFYKLQHQVHESQQRAAKAEDRATKAEAQLRQQVEENRKQIAANAHQLQHMAPPSPAPPVVTLPVPAPLQKPVAPITSPSPHCQGVTPLVMGVLSGKCPIL